MKTSMFQTVILGIFVLLIVVGAIMFANPPADQNQQIQGAVGEVTIWGTYPTTPELTSMLADFNAQYAGTFSVKYEWKDPITFDTDIVEALASQKGPDILLLPDNLILRHSDKIIPMQYQPNFGQREFMNAFVEASEIYIRSTGLTAFPFAIDPMMMYWNRDLFTNASVAEPPKFWDEFLLLAPKLTKTDRSLRVTQSALSFGEYDNVKHAKDILAMLFLQTGSKIVNIVLDKPSVSLTEFSGGGENTAVSSAMRFYMDFSNPQKSVYTWSRSKGNSEEEFLGGNLAVYFDYASAHQRLREKNPNLNFDIAMVPQLRDTQVEVTLARLHGLAAMKSSKNLSTAFVAIRLLLDQKYAAEFATTFNLPPVRRDLLAQKPSDASLSVVYDAALRSRTWLDPRPLESEKAFRAAVDAVSSGKDSPNDAVRGIEDRLDALVSQVSAP